MIYNIEILYTEHKDGDCGIRYFNLCHFYNIACVALYRVPRVVKKRVFYYCLFKTCFKRFFSFLIRFIRFLSVFFCYKI